MAYVRRIIECDHKRTISTVTAGLERTVCEACGHVSVHYIETTVRIFFEVDDLKGPRITGRPSPRRRASEFQQRRRCTFCEESADFLIPGGFACDEDAWVEASRQQVMGSEPWVPIRIDQPTNAG